MANQLRDWLGKVELKLISLNLNKLQNPFNKLLSWVNVLLQKKTDIYCKVHPNGTVRVD